MESVDYLKALELKDTAAEIRIGGRSVAVCRAPLGLHFRLQAILERYDDDPSEGVAAYVAAASGLSLTEIDQGDAAELLAAFAVLMNLNRFQGSLAILWPRPEQKAVRPEDYPNRGLATFVTTLAHAYGWSADHILGLGPEEAMCYLQEAVVIVHKEAEQQWRLAGGPLDSKGKPTKRFPPIQWGRSPETPPRPNRPPIPPHFQPQGPMVTRQQPKRHAP